MSIWSPHILLWITKLLQLIQSLQTASHFHPPPFKPLILPRYAVSLYPSWDHVNIIATRKACKPFCKGLKSKWHQYVGNSEVYKTGEFYNDSQHLCVEAATDTRYLQKQLLPQYAVVCTHWRGAGGGGWVRSQDSASSSTDWQNKMYTTAALRITTFFFFFNL